LISRCWVADLFLVRSHAPLSYRHSAGLLHISIRAERDA
jgi:hypothetical protein